MRISFSSDRTGFPLVHLTELGYDVHLLPVAKAQFEQMAGSDKTFETIFKHASALNPLSTSQDKGAQKIERDFMTGLLPEEALQFAIWLDNDDPTSDYAIPTVKEWRAIYDCLQYERCDPFLHEIIERSKNEHARKLIRRIMKRQPNTLLELSLMRGGVIEWVGRKNEWVGLGNPRPVFYPNTFEPLRETIEPVDAAQRMRTFGFRLIRIF